MRQFNVDPLYATLTQDYSKPNTSNVSYLLGWGGR